MNKVEDSFKYFLQRDVVLSLNGKIIKEGKLVLFSQKDYNVILFFKVNNKEQKKFELPYPFEIVRKNNHLILDYTFSAISKNDSELYYRLASLNQKTNSRYFNTKLVFFEKNTLDFSIVS